MKIFGSHPVDRQTAIDPLGSSEVASGDSSRMVNAEALQQIDAVVVRKSNHFCLSDMSREYLLAGLC